MDHFHDYADGGSAHGRMMAIFGLVVDLALHHGLPIAHLKWVLRTRPLQVRGRGLDARKQNFRLFRQTGEGGTQTGAEVGGYLLGKSIVKFSLGVSQATSAPTGQVLPGGQAVTPWLLVLGALLAL
jgi:hypothetical protein